jgi:ankyrin repeat protein
MNRKGATMAMYITVLVTAIGWAGCRFVRNDELNQAALAGNSKRTMDLLTKGANVNGRGMHSATPIMSAARGGHLTLVKQLIAQGADVNSHNDSGSTLMWAVDSGNEELVSYLLQNGADFRWTNALGSTALDFAREQKKTNIVRTLEALKK